MILGSTIIAVALGLTPVSDGQLIKDSAAVTRQVGRFTERTDRQGARHLRGFDQQGRPYEVTLDKNGQVHAVVGTNLLEFTIAQSH